MIWKQFSNNLAKFICWAQYSKSLIEQKKRPHRDLEFLKCSIHKKATGKRSMNLSAVLWWLLTQIEIGLLVIFLRWLFVKRYSFFLMLRKTFLMNRLWPLKFSVKNCPNWKNIMKLLFMVTVLLTNFVDPHLSMGATSQFRVELIVVP